MRATPKRYALLVLAASLLAGAVRAEEPWESKPAAEWEQEEAIQVLTDSPWGKKVRLLQFTGRMLAVFQDGVREQKVVYQEGPGGPTRQFSRQPNRIEPEVVEAEYAVRWSSAAIVQRAQARLQELSPVVATMYAPPEELPSGYYVLTAQVTKPPSESAFQHLDRPLIVGPDGRPRRDLPPQVSDIFAGLDEEELQQQAELRISKSGRLKPERVERHGLGAGEGISFYFPRRQDGEATLPPGSQWAEFVFESRDGQELKAKFKLEEMQANGRPDY